MENSFQDLLDAVTGISFTVVLSCHDVFKELPTSDQIEDQVVEALFRDAVMEAYNVGMLQQAADPSFSLQFLVIFDPRDTQGVVPTTSSTWKPGQQAS